MSLKAYWQLTLAQLRIFARNRQVIFFSLLFPILLMLMLGSFLGSSGGNISLQAYVIDGDESTASQQLIDTIGQQGIIEVVEPPVTVTDLNGALERLKNGDVQLIVEIPEGYGQSLEAAAAEAAGGSGGAEAGSQPPAGVNVYYDETRMTTAQVGLTVINQVIDGISKSLTGYEPVLAVNPEGVQGVQLEYIDFLVPGIVAMMIMSNNLNGVAGQIASWRERGILRRMQSTPLHASTFISAQITARLLLNGFQALIVLLVGYLFFETQVNGSWALLVMFVVLGTLTFIAMGFIIAGLAKTPESAGPIAGMISFPLLFLGGVFFPISNMPELLQPIVKLLPIAHLSTALRQVMNVGADLTMLWPETLLLLGWMAVSFIVASFTFKWE